MKDTIRFKPGDLFVSDVVSVPNVYVNESPTAMPRDEFVSKLLEIRRRCETPEEIVIIQTAARLLGWDMP